MTNKTKEPRETSVPTEESYPAAPRTAVLHLVQAHAEEPIAEASPFDRVPAELRAALEQRGFDSLTSVQESALDTIRDHRDLRISSQTGSGKTVALGLVMAPEILAFTNAERFNPRDARGPNAVIIAPTRELAAQVQSELHWLFAGVRAIKVECVTGGTSVGDERRRLSRSPRIVVGTPGRLLDHIKSGSLDCSGVTQLVLDEADQMLDMGFRDELEAILAVMPGERRTHMVSATFPAQVQKLAKTYQDNPLHVEGSRLGEANADIEHVAHLIHPRDRISALINILLLADEQRTLVFVRTRVEAAQVASSLEEAGFTAAPLSGDLGQPQRTRTLNAFRNGAVKTLIATDVASRGLDVPDVATVVHLSLPMDALVYTHRSGRTGRAGNKGSSILLAPIAGARRARRLLAEAKIESEWREIPSANTVRKLLKKRARRRLNKALTAEQSFHEGELEYAQRLLEGQDAAKVVAALVKRCQPDRHCEPRIVSNPPPPRFERDDRRGPRRYESDDRRPNDRRPNDRARNTQPMTRFQINWGLHDGANPRRILALVCRRGNINNSVVGAIDISPTSSTIEIATSIATRFESDAQRPDPRNPNLRITRGGSALRQFEANGHAGNGSGHKTNGSKPNGYKGSRFKGNGFKKR